MAASATKPAEKTASVVFATSKERAQRLQMEASKNSAIRKYDCCCRFEECTTVCVCVCLCVCVCAQATQHPAGFVHGSPAEGTSTPSINTHSALFSSLFFFLPHDGPVPQHGPAQRSTVQAELIYLSAVQSNLNKQISP